MDWLTITTSSSSRLLRTKQVFFFLIFSLMHSRSFTLAEQNLCCFFFLPGELYFLATAYPSTSSPFGTIFKFVDPSRWVPELRKGRATQKQSYNALCCPLLNDSPPAAGEPPQGNASRRHFLLKWEGKKFPLYGRKVSKLTYLLSSGTGWGKGDGKWWYFKTECLAK